jgi:hypothetical protein
MVTPYCGSWTLSCDVMGAPRVTRQRRQDPGTKPQVTNGTELERDVTNRQVGMNFACESVGFDSRQLHQRKPVRAKSLGQPSFSPRPASRFGVACRASSRAPVSTIMPRRFGSRRCAVGEPVKPNARSSVRGQNRAAPGRAGAARSTTQTQNSAARVRHYALPP